KCGTPQQAGVQAQTETPQWEYCEIFWEETGYDWSRFSNTVRFWVKSVGPNGSKNIGQTDRVLGVDPFTWSTKKTRESQIAAVDELKAKLLRDGWEPAGKGSDWFDHKFRRRVK